MSTKALGQRGNHGPGAIGRLKPGVTVEQALADLNVISARLEQQYPSRTIRCRRSLLRSTNPWSAVLAIRSC